MNTKSTIQFIAEQIELKNQFLDNLADLNEKFNIENNVFVCDAKGMVHELKEGYFGELKEYDSIQNLKDDYNPYLQGIRVCEGKFYLGNLYTKLSDVKEECIYDLSAAQKIVIL